ncbi:metal ABC transporter ATP-binding protein [Vibrio gallicus]|uniref:metal ABC transporter ATP-binding protein n=1 Tax=Vibrio gallicus TaxID=190897 RepID=UPI0021C36B7A|nr:ABC transporter ATP-binding protein [Vibrio gallicus]
MISVTNLVVGYQNNPIPYTISGDIKKGDLTAIIGPNGVGKTTLLKTLCSLIPSISGEIDWKNECQRDIAWLPQHSNIDRDFPINVFEVVSMGCWPRKSIMGRLSKKDIARVYFALEQTGITDLAKKSISLLSGGQFQRMLFARMLVQDASIMLMDEPFTGIDQETQKILLQLIVELHQQGKTIAAVLHDKDLVDHYFSNIIQFETNKVSFYKNKNLGKVIG